MQQLISEIGSGSLTLNYVLFYFIRYFRHVGDSTCGSYGWPIRALQSANRGCIFTSKDDTVGIPNNLVASITSPSSFERSIRFPAFFLRYNFLMSYLGANRIFISPIIEKSMTRAPISVMTTFRSLSLNVN